MIQPEPDMEFADYIESLEKMLTGGSLPGLVAQMRLSPEGRIDHSYEAAPDGARRSAVLIALHDAASAAGSGFTGAFARPDGNAIPGVEPSSADRPAPGVDTSPARAAPDGETPPADKPAPGGEASPAHQPAPGGEAPPARAAPLGASSPAVVPAFPVIVRSDDGRTHSGQIALPGGAVEESDEFPVGTALREAHEEIGVAPESVRVLGLLTPLYIPVSNYTVYPVVGAVDDSKTPEYVPDEREVSGVLNVRLDRLHDSVRTASFETPRGSIRAPCYEMSDGVSGTLRIWGATAMMLSELVECHRRVCS